MRTLIDLPEADLNKLTEVGANENRSRASLVREAVAEYLERRAPVDAAAFGLWGKHKIDGLAYQRKARAEW
ncbi:MAG TPA: ribbon-helix-helix protein, CopG family [Rudaea sp.]|jgi:metal-responsive CopG/Arc/MetJ family transcriptional regulator